MRISSHLRDSQEAAVEIVGVELAAKMTGLPPATLRYYRHMGTGPASFKIGRRVVYRVAELERWLSEQEKATTRGGVMA
ncbi:helix-turn-helix transcriptional regulator [Mycobacteroides abscessus]|uniref:helix-turn-helix transcriptional regulator n=1 Tax=Mycobacteroides abscessus TaxID=36809 RepID=UPI00373FD4FD